jgi:hypothetical protein
VLSAADFSNKVTPGGRYRLVGDVNAFNFCTDTDGRVYIVISAQSYPERLVFPMINDLILKFKSEFGAPSLTCVAGALDGKAKRMFQTLAEEFDDPTKDKLTATIAQVEKVKSTMAGNIDNMLKNIDTATDIEESTQRLEDQARRFDSQARQLKNRELWKKYKVTCCIILAVILVLGVLILYFAPWQNTGGGAPPGTQTAPPTVPPPTVPPPTVGPS